MFLTLVGGGGGGSIASRVLVPRAQVQPRSGYQSRVQHFDDDNEEEEEDDDDDFSNGYVPAVSRRQTQGRKRSSVGGSRRGGRSKGGRGRGAGGRRRGGDRGGDGDHGGRRDRDRKPMKTAAELDAELDDYHKSSGASSHTGGSSRPSRIRSSGGSGSGFTGQPSMP